jgi:hypothetical protein
MEFSPILTISAPPPGSSIHDLRRKRADPDPAPVEAIIETVRRCPSGALSYPIDCVEYRDQDRALK